MIVTLLDGEKRTLRVGEALLGIGITHAEITSADAWHPQFAEWFAESVLHRFVPPPERGATP